MELELTQDQALLHETTVRFIKNKLPIDRTRALHEDPVGFDRNWLAEAAALGWFTMLVPEDDGGGSVSGDGLVDATIIAEELGRHVQPGPFIPMNVAASAIAANGSATQRSRLLPDVMTSSTVVSWAFAAESGSWDLGAGLNATPGDGRFTLSGTRGFVQDALAADVLLVTATVEGRSAQFLVPALAAGLTVTPLECLDLSRRMAHVRFDDVIVDADGLLGAVEADRAIERQLQIALVLACAETVGAVDALATMTVEYAKDRIAFGRPIGSFQSLKHIMADQTLYLETCKAGAVAAARAVQRDADDAGEVASMVAAYVGDMADWIAQMALQIHGGIGYTWEHDLHLLLRRVRSNAALYGESSWHRERVCRLHGLGAGG